MKIAFLFAGQGSQYVGMGQELYDHFEIVKDRFRAASDLLGYDVTKMLFQDNDDLNDTRYTQPLMFVLYASIRDLLLEQGIESTHTCGLSLGEYGALYDAGVITFEQGLQLLVARGKAMADASSDVQGSMSAILGIDASPLEAIIDAVDGYVTIANYNTYGQLVISGEEDAVLAVNQQALDAGAKRAILLNTSGPFHSKLMNPARVAFDKTLEQVPVQAPNKVLLTNVNGSYAPQDLKTSLSKQITHSVLFYQMVEALLQEGVETFIEIGPKRTLSSFIKKINRKVTIRNVEDLASLEQTKQTLEVM